MTASPTEYHDIDPSSRRGSVWGPVIKHLRENPGRWFSFEEIGPTQVVRHTVRLGSPKAFQPPGAFDMVRRDGKAIFCYLGDPIEPWDPQGLKTGEQDPRKFDQLERRFVAPKAG